jgi:hypothetical protein
MSSGRVFGADAATTVGLTVVNGDVEEPLYLRGVQIHRDLEGWVLVSRNTGDIRGMK